MCHGRRARTEKRFLVRLKKSNFCRIDNDLEYRCDAIGHVYRPLFSRGTTLARQIDSHFSFSMPVDRKICLTTGHVPHSFASSVSLCVTFTRYEINEQTRHAIRSSGLHLCLSNRMSIVTHATITSLSPDAGPKQLTGSIQRTLSRVRIVTYQPE